MSENTQPKGTRGRLKIPLTPSGSKATQFKPGQSGNPSGRPKGFAARIKELCGDDYEQIAVGLYLIAKGTDDQVREFYGETFTRSAKDRALAWRELRDSGPGRPAQTLEHRGDVPGMVRVIHEETVIDPSKDVQ